MVETHRVVTKKPHDSVNRPSAREPLPVPDSARVIQRSIIDHLEPLVRGRAVLDPEFQAAWQRVLSLADRYREEITENSGRTVSCAVGCSSCCCHWVEDVNSFEAEAIAARLKRSAYDRIPVIIDRCNSDSAILSQLNALVEVQLALLDPASCAAAIDPTDLLLASFYRLGKPCPLLDVYSRTCIVYPLRPLTCRLYVSFKNPVKCTPGFADDTDIPTYLFDLEERADELIDRLHFKFMKFEGDTGLRSLLPKYLLA